MKKLWVLSIFACSVLFSTAQEVYHFKSGLFASIPSRYGREALYTDMLAYQIYTNTIKIPKENTVWGKGEHGEDIIWKSLTADSANRLISREGRGGFGFGRGGYIYLTYTSATERTALLNVRGAGGLFFNGRPEITDPYSAGWLNIPVKLKKGLNEIYLRGRFAMASLSFPSKPVLLHTGDPTLPTIVIGEENKTLDGAIVIINTTNRELKGLQIKASISGEPVTSELPTVPALATRKVPFRFDASTVTSAGKYDCRILLLQKNKTIDEASIQVEAAIASDKYSRTFISMIDGSLQYYAVAPQISPKPNSALFLSVHGAGVEAIGQARAYRSKDWGTLVAPTNRRPRGFNWEDWGRLDAFEVLQLAKERFKPDPQKIYLTGHSMGGHGTWFLGATYPDKWAAIAPCAGYPTLKGYGSADGLIPDSSNNPVEQTLLRASNQSDVIKLASNFKPLGVYIFHGDDDRTVSVNYARQMRGILGAFHTDLSYYEYPGGSHWFGDESVDWAPLFDYFKWHHRPLDSAVNHIDFTTANPGISSSYYWATIYQQQQPLQYSRIQLNRNRSQYRIEGRTENVRLLQFALGDFGQGKQITIVLDSLPPLNYTTASSSDTIFLLKKNNSWALSVKPGTDQKGPHRNGTFKDAFNHRMIYVYGTNGNKEENEWALNKARYDAAAWYYRGNGAVDIVADKDFSLEKFRDRGIILYGNKTTNKAWTMLLADCPLQVERNRIIAGSQTWEGDDLAAYFVWPIRQSSITSVAVISGSGINGMKAANANQYFAGASGFPDYMIFSLDMLKNGANEVKAAGFFDNDWKLSK